MSILVALPASRSWARGERSDVGEGGGKLSTDLDVRNAGLQGMPRDCSPALTIASTKSKALNGNELGPVSRSSEPLRMSILCRSWRGPESLSNPTKDDWRDNGSVEGTNREDECLCVLDSWDCSWIGRRKHLLTVWVDVPYAFNTSWEILILLFWELYVALTQSGQSSRNVCIFNLKFKAVDIGTGLDPDCLWLLRGSCIECNNDGGMRDIILTDDGLPIGQTSCNVVREGWINARNYSNLVVRDLADAAQ